MTATQLREAIFRKKCYDRVLKAGERVVLAMDRLTYYMGWSEGVYYSIVW